MRLRILIADNHEVSRIGIRNILQGDSRLDVCGQAIDGRDAIEKVRTLKPDVIVMDALMSGTTGIEAARQIRKIAPSTKVVILSVHEPAAVTQFTTAAGADAFLLKAQCVAHLNETIFHAVKSRSDVG